MIAQVSRRRRTLLWHLLVAAILVPLVVPRFADAQQCENVPVNLRNKNFFWHEAPPAGSAFTVGIEGGTAGVPTATIDGVTQGLASWTAANGSGSGVSFTPDLNNQNASIMIRLENTEAYGTIPASVCGSGQVCAGYMATNSGFTGSATGGRMGLAKGMISSHTRYVVLHELAHFQGLDHVAAPTGSTLMAEGASNYSMQDPSPCDVLNVRDVAKNRRAEFRRDPCNGGPCGVNAHWQLPQCRWGGAPVNGWCSPVFGGPPFGWFPTKWETSVRWWASPTPPVGGITSPTIVPTSGNITLAAIDQDGKVMRVDWYVNGTYVYTALEDPFHLPYTNAVPGSYTIQAQMWDHSEGTSWSQQVVITVQNIGPTNPGTTLGPWQRLYAGQQLYSPNGQFFLTHQGVDGHLVLYQGGTPVWATGVTVPGGGGYTEMDGSSGNLVGYGPGGWPPYWAANPPVSSGSYLRLHDDGSLLMYYSNGTYMCNVRNIQWTQHGPCLP